MNRILFGALLGIAFGLIDVAMTVFGNHPEREATMLLQAFFSRFAIGLLAANVNLRHFLLSLFLQLIFRRNDVQFL